MISSDTIVVVSAMMEAVCLPKNKKKLKKNILKKNKKKRKKIKIKKNIYFLLYLVICWRFGIEIFYTKNSIDRHKYQVWGIFR